MFTYYIVVHRIKVAMVSIVDLVVCGGLYHVFGDGGMEMSILVEMFFCVWKDMLGHCMVQNFVLKY